MKNKIIQTAKKRFFKEGLKKVHMDDIASDMGVSKKTLYKHFGSKEELAGAAVMLFQEEIREALASFRENTEDPIERFEKIVRFANKKLSEAGPLFLNDIKREVPALWRSIEDFRRQEIMSHMNDILTEGKRKKQIRPEIDTHIATLVYLGAIETIIQPDVLEENNISLDDAFANIRNIFLGGIKTKIQEGKNAEI
jgi:AcrR family transcriptional regulator